MEITIDLVDLGWHIIAAFPGLLICYYGGYRQGRADSR